MQERIRHNTRSVLWFTALLLSVTNTQAQNKTLVTGSNATTIFRPKKVDVTAQRLQQLKVPEGFTVQVFAEGTGHPRMMEVLPDGRVYLTDRDEGKLTLLWDTTADGKADVKKVLWEIEHLHGIDYFKDMLYLVAVKEVYSVKLNDDGSLGKIKPVATGLPDAGQHHNRTLKFGPDTLMYVSIGSTCNSCRETNKEAAVMLQMFADGMGKKVYCKGLRNTIGFDWHPKTGELWGWDNGIDHLGDTVGKEELNKLEEGKDYGWPYIYEKGRFDMHHDPPKMSHGEYAAQTVFPALLYDAHGASMDFMFYTGDQFPGEYRNDAFVAMRGSWNRQEPSGYKVLRVRFNRAGQPVELENFFWGFLTDGNTSQFGRPVGLAQYTDGSLLVSDDQNGVIYRIVYKSTDQ